MQRAPVTYSVQFQNGGFSLSDLIYISHSFVEFSKNQGRWNDVKARGADFREMALLN